VSRTIVVAPSLLAADPLRFGEDLADVEKAGADFDLRHTAHQSN